MRICQQIISAIVAAAALIAGARDARAQTSTQESRWSADVGVGIDSSINGNVNSGAIGTLQGFTAAILPNPYGDVYGTGIQIRGGAGYMLNESTELRGILTYRSAAADLVRLGDIGPSNLYGQYSDYKSVGLDFGLRRYLSLTRSVRAFGEATIGIAFIDRINVQLAAPQANIIFNNTDFYDSTGAFTWTLSGGLAFQVAEQVDLTAQLGLRHVGGLSDVDQLVGTGLAEINNDSGRLTFPIVVGVRFRFN